MDEARQAEIGSALKDRREQAHLTQDDVLFASRMTLPRSMRLAKATFSRIENGRAVPDPHIAKWLCHLYGCNLRDVAPEIAEALETYERSLTIDIRDTVVRAYGWLGDAGLEHYEQMSLLANDTSNTYILDITVDATTHVEERPRPAKKQAA